MFWTGDEYEYEGAVAGGFESESIELTRRECVCLCHHPPDFIVIITLIC